MAARSARQQLRTFERSLPMALLRAREAVMDAFRPHLRALGVTEQQWRILRALQDVGECSVSALADTTCISLPSLSRILVGLGDRGLVTRRSDTTDLRRSFIRISATGQALLASGAAESERIYEDLEQRLGPARAQDLYELLDAVSALDRRGDGEP